MSLDSHLREEVPVLAVVALAALLRFYQLGTESLWTDELITLDFVGRWDGLTLLLQLPQHQPHLPLYYVVLDVWARLVGDSAAMLRLPSAVFGVAAVAALFLVGRRLADDRVGFVAALVLAVSPFHIRWSQEVRMYSLLVFLSAASMYTLLRLRDDPSRRAALVYAATTGLLIYTHVFGFFVAVAQFAYLGYRWYDEGGLEPTRTWAVAVGLVAAAIAPLFVVAAVKLQGGAPPLAYVPEPTLPIVAMMISSYVGYGFGTTWLVHAAIVPLFLGTAALGFVQFRTTGGTSLRERLGGVSAVPSVSDPAIFAATWFLVPFGLSLLLSVLVTPVFWPRYTIVASPGLFLLVGVGVRRVESRHLQVALAGLLVLSTVPSLAIHYSTDRKEQWDEVGAMLENRATADDLVVVADVQQKRGVTYYTDDLQVEGVAVEGSGTGYAPDSTGEIRRTVAGEDRVWLVFSHAPPDERERVRSVVAENRTQAFHRQYEGIEVYLYESGGDG